MIFTMDYVSIKSWLVFTTNTNSASLGTESLVLLC